MAGNYPAGVTDNDPHFDVPSVGDDEETGHRASEEDDEPEHCPFCDRDGVTMEHIEACSGYRSSGMPPNETGHPYGCGCPDCMSEYQSLK